MQSNLAAEIDWKGHVDRILIFGKKKQEALEKKLGCKCIRANLNKESYDISYEIGRTQTFITEFKKILKELEKEIQKWKDLILKMINHTRKLTKLE